MGSTVNQIYNPYELSYTMTYLIWSYGLIDSNITLFYDMEFQTIKLVIYTDNRGLIDGIAIPRQTDWQ